MLHLLCQLDIQLVLLVLFGHAGHYVLQVVVEQVDGCVVAVVVDQPDAALAKQCCTGIDVEQQNAGFVVGLARLVTFVTCVTLVTNAWLAQLCFAHWDPVQQAAKPVVKVMF